MPDISAFLIETFIVLMIAGFSCVLGFYLGKRTRFLHFPFAVLGIIFLMIKVISLRFPAIYLYLPRLWGMTMDILQAMGCIFLGIAYRFTRKRGVQRIIFAVVVGLFLFFIFFNKACAIFSWEDFSRLGRNLKQGVVLQSTPYTCYPAAASTILFHWKIYATEGRIASLARTTILGTEDFRMIYAIEEASKGKYLRVKIEILSIEELRRLDHPCILGVVIKSKSREIWHAVVFLGMKEGFFIIGDPLGGLKKFSEEQLIERYKWKGWSLIVSYPMENNCISHD